MFLLFLFLNLPFPYNTFLSNLLFFHSTKVKKKKNSNIYICCFRFHQSHSNSDLAEDSRKPQGGVLAPSLFLDAINHKNCDPGQMLYCIY